MDGLEAQVKTEMITFMVTPELKKKINKLMKKKGWRRSAFIRLAIEHELDRIEKKKK